MRFSARIAAAALLATVALAGASCRRQEPSGADDVPRGVPAVCGAYEDMAPRWSRDGRRIAFLRATSDRRMQLCLAPTDLSRAIGLIAPEVVSPDRDYQPSRAGLRAPEGPVWSPGDRRIAFSRIERFTFDDGERLPGLSIWSYDVKSGRTDPLAVHPRKYDGVFHYYRSPTWSPTGKHLAVMGEGVNGESALCIHPTSGTAPDTWQPRYDAFADTDWPTWVPGTDLLIYRQGITRGPSADRYETLRIAQPGGTVARRLLTISPQMCRQMLGFPPGSRVDPRVASPAVSPDGATVVFALWPDGLTPSLASIWTLSLRGDPVLRRVSPADGCGYTAPTWIDGTRIGVARMGLGGLQAAVLGSGAAAPSRIVCALPSGDFDWSPDRSAIVCAGPAYTGAGPRPATTLRILATNIRAARRIR